MTSALDMSLDDLIKNNKTATRGGGRSGGGGGGRGTGSRRGAASAGGYPGSKASGPVRRPMSRATARPSPYATAKARKRGILSLFT